MNWLNILHSLHVYQYSTLSHTAGAMNLLRYSEQRHWIYRLIWYMSYIGWSFLIACLTTITPLYWMTSTTFSNRPYHPKNNNWFLTNTILSPPLCRKKNILASISYWIYQLGLKLSPSQHVSGLSTTGKAKYGLLSKIYQASFPAGSLFTRPVSLQGVEWRNILEYD